MGKLKDLSVEKIKEVVISSNSMNEVLRKINYKNRTTGIKYLKQLFLQNQIDTSHFKTINPKKDKLEDYLIEDSVLHSNLRRRVVSEIFNGTCLGCGNQGVWNGLPITIQLDHIDGNPFNNKIENLRPLCPNCHSQTSTFGNKRRHPKVKEKKVPNPVKQKEKKEKILELVKNKVVPLLGLKTIKEISKEVGLSHKTIKKYCKELGVEIPSHVFWAKKKESVENNREKLKDKPQVNKRKHDYKSIYDYFLETNSYEKVGLKFGMHRSAARMIILRQKKYYEKELL